MDPRNKSSSPFFVKADLTHHDGFTLGFCLHLPDSQTSPVVHAVQLLEGVWFRQLLSSLGNADHKGFVSKPRTDAWRPCTERVWETGCVIESFGFTVWSAKAKNVMGHVCFSWKDARHTVRPCVRMTCIADKNGESPCHGSEQSYTTRNPRICCSRHIIPKEAPSVLNLGRVATSRISWYFTSPHVAWRTYLIKTWRSSNMYKGYEG